MRNDKTFSDKICKKCGKKFKGPNRDKYCERCNTIRAEKAKKNGCLLVVILSVGFGFFKFIFSKFRKRLY